MIGAKVEYTDTTKRVEEAVDKAAYRSLSHAAASIRKAAIASLEKTAGPSAAGTPPHTRGRLKRAIVYDADKQSAVIGPRYSRFGIALQAHEHEGVRVYRGQRFPPRQTMFPALQRNLSRFAQAWAGSVHS